MDGIPAVSILVKPKVLLLVRDYVEKNGGNLSIESVENEWSEFSFLLPKANVNSGGKKTISI